MDNPAVVTVPAPPQAETPEPREVPKEFVRRPAKGWADSPPVRSDHDRVPEQP